MLFYFFGEYSNLRELSLLLYSSTKVSFICYLLCMKDFIYKGGILYKNTRSFQIQVDENKLSNTSCRTQAFKYKLQKTSFMLRVLSLDTSRGECSNVRVLVFYNEFFILFFSASDIFYSPFLKLILFNYNYHTLIYVKETI